MYNNNKQPAVWTAQEHFSVSEAGAIKPSGDAYEGKPRFMTLDAAEHILANLDSFRKAIELSRSRVLNKVAGKEINKMRVQFIKLGLTPEAAEAAVQAVLAKKSA